jgi:MarR family transcriptional regulator, lower aerobic nicotinate degradation pathway regulator
MATTADRSTVTHQSLALVNHLARVSRRGSEAALAPLGLRPLHLVALTLLRDHGSATQQALAETMRIDPSNLVGLLNDLEREEFLVRQRDPGDRRRHIVELSQAGRASLERAERALAAVQDDVLGTLDDDERATLHALLLRAAGGQFPGSECVEAASETC